MEGTPKTIRYAAEAYELLYAHHIWCCRRHIKEIQKVLGSNKKPRTILAVACGTGIDLEMCNELGWEGQFFGFDIDPGFVEVAHANLARKRIKADLWVGDLLEPRFGNSLPSEGVDLAILRGNTIGHFSADQYAGIFENLFHALGAEGILLFDFRDGRCYFAQRSPIEFLGAGKLPKGGYFISFYLRRWPKTFDGTFTVSGRTLHVTWRGIKIVRHPTIAGGEFNRSELILAAAEQAGFVSLTEVTDEVGQSLQCLRTFVAHKGA